MSRRTTGRARHAGVVVAALGVLSGAGNRAVAASAWQTGQYRELTPQMGRAAPAVGARALTTSIAVGYTAVQPPTAVPGEAVALRAEYDVATPEGAIDVKETRIIRFEGQQLAKLARVVSRRTGRVASEYALKVPLDAALGWYTVETALEPKIATRSVRAPERTTSAFYIQPGAVPAPSTVGPAEDGIHMRLWADKPRYKVGEAVKVFFESSRDAYVTLVNVGTSGRITILYPNKFSPNNAVKAGRTYSVPGAGERYRLALRGPAGVELVYALVTATPTRFSAAHLTKDVFATVNHRADALTRDLNRAVKKTPLTERASAAVEIEVAP